MQWIPIQKNRFRPLLTTEIESEKERPGGAAKETVQQREQQRTNYAQSIVRKFSAINRIHSFDAAWPARKAILNTHTQ